MDWTGYQMMLALVMLITGSINTLSAKWADQLDAVGVDKGGPRPFDHPFFQAVGMFLGETLCLATFYIVRLRHRCANIPLDIGPQEFNPLIFWPAALLDMCATSLMYIGLNLTFASSFQMLRGAIIIFTALLSVAFLGRIVRVHMWVGMGVISVGLILVGLSDVLLNKMGSDKTMNAIIAGDLIIIMAQIVQATQMVYEERVVRKHLVPPLQAAGLEGVFGFFTLGLLLIPFYYIRAEAPFTNDPEDRLENVLDAFAQMANNKLIIVATLGNVLSIAFFNFSGISITKEISATTRMVLDSCRTLIIWAVSLGVRWQTFTPWSFSVQLAGFFLLLVGMCLYNDIVIRPWLRSVGCLAPPGQEEPDPDEFEPLIGSDPDARRRREVTYGGGRRDPVQPPDDTQPLIN